MTRRPAPPAPPVDTGPPPPHFKEGLLRCFAGTRLEAAVRDGTFALGVIPQHRRFAEQTLREMEADPAAVRRRFGLEG